MNNIATIQNDQKQLERLSAQRELYSSAKKLYVIQIWGNVVIPIAFAVTSLFHFKVAVFAAMFAIVFFIIDLILIIPVISIKKGKAAKIQELFDCDVLQIPKSPLKTSSDIAVEEVLLHYEAHNKIKSNVEKVRDWYSPEISSLDIDFARLICQRTNCWWDAKLRVRYMNTLRLMSVIIPLIILVAGIMIKMQIDELVLIASSLMPLFKFAGKEFSDHKTANDRLEKTHNYILKIWDNVLKNCYEKGTLLSESRMIQDEIYEHRTKSPFILDFIYNLFREKNELLMNKTAAILVLEIKQLNLKPKIE
jgi:hypothetical protein